jgi:TolA-binding protein
MKFKFLITKNVFLAVFAASFCCLVLTFQVSAQTKKKKSKKPNQPVVLTNPVSQQTLPVIISRADDFPNGNQVVVTENPSVQQETEADTVDEKMDKVNSSLNKLNTRIKSLESTQKNEYDEKQKRLLLNLDILTRAEQRVEALRKQLFEIIEKQSGTQSRLDQLDYELKPEIIERNSALSGSLKPESVRDARKQALEKEKQNLQGLILQVDANRVSLELSVQKADLLVEKLRFKLEKDIDDALTDKDEQ